MRRTIITLAIVLSLASCNKPTPSVVRNRFVLAANQFTQTLERSPRANWKARARAVGRDCDVLLIDAPVILEDALIDSMHYGAGEKRVAPGGVYGFCRDAGFRGTAYKDRSGRIWVFGEITAHEAAAMEPCD